MKTKQVTIIDDNEADRCLIKHELEERGYSVKEVIQTMKEVTCKDFQVDNEPRRAGDPATLISDNAKIKTKMHWIPKYESLNIICQSAYEWEKRS